MSTSQQRFPLFRPGKFFATREEGTKVRESPPKKEVFLLLFGKVFCYLRGGQGNLESGHIWGNEASTSVRVSFLLPERERGPRGP